MKDDMGLEDDYRTLLNKMAAKHAVERFLIAFLMLCVLGVGVLLFLQNRELTVEIKSQQQAVQDRNHFFANNQKEIQQQTTEIKGYIQCIAEFFAQPNRSDLTLNNLQSCQFGSTGSGAATSAVVPQQPQTTNPNAQQPTTSEPPRPSTSTTPTTTPSQPQQPSSPQPPTQPAGFLQQAVSTVTGLVNRLL